MKGRRKEIILLLQIRKTTDFSIFVLRQKFAIFLEMVFTFRFDFYWSIQDFAILLKKCDPVFSQQNPWEIA